MSIFSDMVEDTIEVFMDDFFVVGYSFERCLTNLSEVLKRYEDCNLVLNLEKCHFMVLEGIVLGHRISEKGIEVDRAKVEVIERLPPTNLCERCEKLSWACRFLPEIHQRLFKACTPVVQTARERL